MSEFNPDLTIQKVPGDIEELEAASKKLMDAIPTMKDVAKRTGAKNFIDTVNALEAALLECQETVKRYVGQEGDTAEGEGTFWSAVTVAKKVKIATGGAD